MNLTIDNHSAEVTIHDPDWIKIERSLEQIDPNTRCYLILTASCGNYLQCAGSKDRLTIELREYTENSFKHFVLGKRVEKSPLLTIWDLIECRVGPINVHDHEVLSLVDAVVIFKAFYEGSEIPSAYKRRNVTRQHQNIR